MAAMNEFERRRFLGTLGGAALLSAMPGLSRADSKFEPDLDLELRAVPDEVPLFSGAATGVWRYRAKVHKGNPAAVATLPGSYLGPVIRVPRGARVRVRFFNDLPQATVVHWHGLLVPEAMDGHPRHAIAPGGQYVYEFEVRNRAGTYWFHPHPHGYTGYQVYGGLAGLFIVSDDEEHALGLPDGPQDMPLVIQDRSFDADHQLRYLGGGMGAMHTRMNGFLGDRILVNGYPDHAWTAERRPYRLRLLNGSNARIYKLAWSDGRPLTVIGSDGGLLAAPVQRPYVTLAPAERVELWVDFSARAAGERVRLLSLPLAAYADEAFTVFDVHVANGGARRGQLPARLTRIDPPRPEEALNRRQPRSMQITAGGMRWGLNGRVFEMNEVAPDEVVRLGSTEVWQFINEGGMGMMGGMPHPMHIHGVQFRVIGRQVHPAALAAWRQLSAGFVDDGWKDTVLVMPGERVQVLIRFKDHAGMFLYHCHNLEHEDMGMMRNFLIRA